jgi:hypothetical protein
MIGPGAAFKGAGPQQENPARRLEDDPRLRIARGEFTLPMKYGSATAMTDKFSVMPKKRVETSVVATNNTSKLLQ